jgi:hypothetical protein
VETLKTHRGDAHASVARVLVQLIYTSIVFIFTSLKNCLNPDVMSGEDNADGKQMLSRRQYNDENTEKLCLQILNDFSSTVTICCKFFLLIMQNKFGSISDYNIKFF